MNLNKRLINRFGLFLGSSLTLLAIISYINFYYRNGYISITIPQVILIVLTLLTIFTRNYSWGRHIQILTLIALAAVIFYKAPRRGLGIPIFFILSLLSQKYGYLENYRILKISISLVLIVIINIIALYMNNISLWVFLPIFLFAIMFFVSFYIIHLEMFVEYMQMEKRQKQEITTLKCKLSEITEFINPIECGLTEAELELLKLLCTYKGSNADLAQRLNKSVSTIKSQLSKIYNKIGVDSRHQLIDLCEHYYRQIHPDG